MAQTATPTKSNRQPDDTPPATSAAPSSDSAETAAPLTPEQRTRLAEATERARTFMGAAKVAAVNGWTLGFFAAVSILLGLTSPVSLLLGMSLAVIARNEFTGRARTRSLDPSGLELLWRNQIGLMTVIAAYGGWSMVRAVAFPDARMAELTELLGQDSGELIQTLTVGTYAVVIVLAALFQGLNARYYFVRVRRLREHLHLTPEWVLDLQRSVGGQVPLD